jgi:hypothetical protein
VNASFSEALELELSFFFRREKFPLLGILNFTGTFRFRFELRSDSDAKVVGRAIYQRQIQVLFII